MKTPLYIFINYIKKYKFNHSKTIYKKILYHMRYISLLKTL